MSQAVLQNTAAFYKARYDVAQDHVFKGEIDQALDILWEMQLKPDLGLYRRALVNLLIACNADVRLHDCSVFANECLELLKQLQRDGYPPNEGTLQIENHARETLKAIAMEEAEWKAIEMEEAELERVEQQTAKSGETPSSMLENLKLGEESKPEDPMDTDDAQDQQLPQIPEPRAKSTSIIEGMYTDHYGHEEKAEQVEKAADKEPSQLLTPNPTSEIGMAE